MPIRFVTFYDVEYVSQGATNLLKHYRTNLAAVPGAANSTKARVASSPLSWATALLSMTNFFTFPANLENSELSSSSRLKSFVASS